MRGFAQLLYHPPPTLLLILPLSGLTFLLIAAAASLSLSVGGADARDILAKKTNRRNKNSGSSRCSSSMPSGAKSMSSGGSSGSYAYGSMAGGKFKKVKAKSMKACFDACVDTANCETFVYVLTSTEVREKGGDSHSRYAPRSFARYKKEGKRCKVETSGGKVMYCADKASKKKGELVGVVTAAKEAQLIGGDTGGAGGQAAANTWAQVAAHDHIARKQQADLAVDVHRAMGQRWIARSEDQIVLHILIQFGLQRGLHIDLRQHTKTLSGECFSGAGHRLGERRLQRRRDSDRHPGLPRDVTVPIVPANPGTGAGARDEGLSFFIESSHND